MRVSIGMKRRWIAIVTVMLVLAACRPADSGAGESPANPAPASTIDAEPSASSTPYSMDGY